MGHPGIGRWREIRSASAALLGAGRPILVCTSWPRLFSRFCKAQGLWGVVIQVLAQKRAKDASTKGHPMEAVKYYDSEFFKARDSLCMGYYGTKPCFPNPSWPLKLTPPQNTPSKPPWERQGDPRAFLTPALSSSSTQSARPYCAARWSGV